MKPEDLTEALKSKMAGNRQRAIREASEEPSPQILALIQSAVNDEDPAVRRTVICALGRMKLVAGIPEMEAALANDPEPLVRSAAAKWLGLNHWSEDKRQKAAAEDKDQQVKNMARLEFP